MRFEGRMSCEWRIDPAAEPAQVPPFLLQPLIENAVKYGVDTSPGQTKINITVQVQDAHLLIEITHLCSVIGPRHSARDGLQIGINNLRMRLDALYGQQHWLLEQRFEAGCSETVLLIPSGRPKNAVNRLANS
jgi:two-component system, LytTR family, sensor kinase